MSEIEVCEYETGFFLIDRARVMDACFDESLQRAPSCDSFDYQTREEAEAAKARFEERERLDQLERQTHCPSCKGKLRGTAGDVLSRDGKSYYCSLECWKERESEEPVGTSLAPVKNDHTHESAEASRRFEGEPKRMVYDEPPATPLRMSSAAEWHNRNTSVDATAGWEE